MTLYLLALSYPPSPGRETVECDALVSLCGGWEWTRRPSRVLLKPDGSPVCDWEKVTPPGLCVHGRLDGWNQSSPGFKSLWKWSGRWDSSPDILVESRSSRRWLGVYSVPEQPLALAHAAWLFMLSSLCAKTNGSGVHVTVPLL